MRLSEAIRLGAMLKPQAHQGPGGGDLALQKTTCALAAACEAIGLKRLNVHSEEWVLAFPIEKINGVPCPVCWRHADWPFGGVITHLNDVHRWTREAIADYVEQIERRADAEKAAEQETATAAVAHSAPKEVFESSHAHE